VQMRKTATICVVDDEEDILILLRDLLEPQDCQCVTFRSCEAACKAISEGEDFDVILTDKHVAGSIDGITFAQELEKKGLKIPIVIMSGDGRPSQSDLPGLVKYVLAKPFGNEELNAALEAVLPESVNSSD